MIFADSNRNLSLYEMSDFLPKSQVYSFCRYHVYITALLVVAKAVVNSSNHRSTKMLYTLEITSCLQITIS